MKYCHIFLSTLVLSLPPAGMAYAKEYEAPLALPDHARILMTIARSARGEGVADIAGKIIMFQYRLDTTRTNEGYRVHQILTRTDIPPEIPPAVRSMIAQGAAISHDTDYEADESLMPVRILDWKNRAEAMVQAADNLMGPSSQTQAALAGMRQRFLGMTAEQGAAILKEQGMVAAAQGLALDLNEPVSVETQMPNPLGGATPIKATVTVSLERWDKSKNEALVHIRREFDSESLGQNMREMLLANFGRSKEAEAGLAGIKVGNVLECRAQIDTSTGLATDTSCDSTVTSVDRNLKPRERIDRWSIGQLLMK